MSEAGEAAGAHPGSPGALPGDGEAVPGLAKVGFFSFTEVTDGREHRSYNEWHQMDHLPEQYTVPGILLGERWVSTPACRSARLCSHTPLDPSHYLTLYLMADPVDRTLEQFLDLGRRLRAAGRFHLHRRALLSGPFDLRAAAAAPRLQVSAEAIPHRPNLGVLVIVESVEGPDRVQDHLEAIGSRRLPLLLGQRGVAGCYLFSARPPGPSHPWRPGSHLVTLCYLDEDPLEVTAEAAGLLEPDWRDGPARPVLAGPFERVVPWSWDWFEQPPGA